MPEEPELSPEAKLLIQSYMLKFVIPSAAALAIISGAIGYAIDRVARNDAYAEAFAKITPELINAVGQTESAKTEAQLAKSAADKVVGELETTKNETLALTTGLKQQKLDVDKILGGNLDAIATKLASNDDFKSKLVKVNQEEIDAVKTKQDAQGALIAAFGGGRILAIARVKNGVLNSKSDGVSFANGIVSFPNPKNLMFIPLISNSTEYPYITTAYWIKQIGPGNTFTVGQHAMDTGGADRNFPASDFTAVVIGFEG